MSADTSELYNGNFESSDPRFSEVFKNGIKGNIYETFQNKDIMNFLDSFAANEELREILLGEIKKYHLICQLLDSNCSNEKKKNLLETALKRQKEASKKMDTGKLDKISSKMFDSIKTIVGNDSKIINFLLGRNNDITTFSEKKEIFQKILDALSESFQIHPPKLYTDGLAIRGLGTSTFIKVDTDPWSIGNLLHEFTHYLQHHGRTSPFKYIKQSRKWYVLGGLFSDDVDLYDLAMKVYDESLMEKEAEYVSRKANSCLMNYFRTL